MLSQAELGSGEVRAPCESPVQLCELGIEDPGRLAVEDNAVVGPGKILEALEPKPYERALGRLRGKERRLRIALLEVFHDHARLRQDEVPLLEHGHLPDRVLLVEPGGAVLELDLDVSKGISFSARRIRTRAQYGQRAAS